MPASRRASCGRCRAERISDPTRTMMLKLRTRTPITVSDRASPARGTVFGAPGVAGFAGLVGGAGVLGLVGGAGVLGLVGGAGVLGVSGFAGVAGVSGLAGRLGPAASTTGRDRRE